MKTLVITLLLSLNVFAGDLNLVCFTNQDPGDYLFEPIPFMTTNKIEVAFKNIKLSVTRDSLFENYVYRFNDQIAKPTNYDDWVKVSENIHCQVSD